MDVDAAYLRELQSIAADLAGLPLNLLRDTDVPRSDFMSVYGVLSHIQKRSRGITAAVDPNENAATVTALSQPKDGTNSKQPEDSTAAPDGQHIHHYERVEPDDPSRAAYYECACGDSIPF